MDDVLFALAALVLLLLSLAFVVQVLAEGEGDAAPAFVGEHVPGAPLHTHPRMLEAPAGHAVGGRPGPQAPPEAELVAALVVLGAGAMLALDRAHWRREGGGKDMLIN